MLSVSIDFRQRWKTVNIFCCLSCFKGLQNNEAFADKEDSPFARSAFFVTKENKRLQGHVGKRIKSPSLLSCSHACKINEWCTSTNFKLNPPRMTTKELVN